MSQTRLRAVTALALSSALTITALAAVPAALAADEPRVQVAPDGDLLEGPLSGEAALSSLGDDLPLAADRNGMTPQQLGSVLRHDRTARLDSGGRLHYVDPAPASSQLAAMPDTPGQAVAPLEETFQLNSLPGAQLTIFLDFDGATVDNTMWNSGYGVPAGSYPAWDPAGDGPGFSDAERIRVQEAWAIVAGDFAPFDVNVTTQDPGDAALVRSSATDPTYGTRVLVTPSAEAQSAICGGACGGVAYVGTFPVTGGAYQPAWVFPQSLGDRAKTVAEASSHEAGHNLGLHHDGITTSTGTNTYYRGHGHWAPIMGAGYDRAVSQWSRGSYTGATNTQDDVTTIAGHLGRRPDENSGDPAAATAFPSDRAYITAAADVDAFTLGRCAPGSTIHVRPADLAPNLDVRAQLVDGAGVVRADSDPASGPGDNTTATGMDAQLTVPSPASPAAWTVVVEGVGSGTWATNGYDDYGSLGAYTVEAPGCGLPDVLPASPTNLTGAYDPVGDSLVIGWDAPTHTGSHPLTGYRISVDGAHWAQVQPEVHNSAIALAVPFTERPYAVGVAAVTAAGVSPEAEVTITVEFPDPPTTPAPAPAAGVPDRVARPKVVVRGRKVVITWRTPANNRSPIRRFRVDFSRGKDRTVKAGKNRLVLRLARPGRTRVRVRAINGVGKGANSRWTAFRIR